MKPKLIKTWRLLSAILGVWMALQGSMYGLNIGLYNLTNNELSPQINFETVSATAAYVTAKQYLKVEYPENVERKIQIYTNNTSWADAENSNRAGLVSTNTNKHRIPLYWKEFSEPQGQVDFSANSERSWKIMGDKISGFDAQSASLASQPNKVSYIYFGTKVLPDALPGGEYQARFSVEALDDKTVPVIVESPCKKVIVGEPTKFKTLLQDDLGIRGATVYFRTKGNPIYQSQALQLSKSPYNSRQWTAEAPIKLMSGSFQYFLEVTDGVHAVKFGNAETPRDGEVVGEFAAIPINVTPAGSVAAVKSQCIETDQAPVLMLQPGSINQSMQIFVKKKQPSSLPRWRGREALAAYEFSPDGLQFIRPVTLQMPYVDANADGKVDETEEDVQSLRIFWFDGIEWRNMGGSVDTANRMVSATISHFSVYGILPAGPSTDDDIRPRENIITPNGDGVNDFAQFGISGDFQIRIFDIRGRKVRTLDNLNVWDGRDNGGELVESGVYIFQVEAQTKVSGMIAVERS